MKTYQEQNYPVSVRVSVKIYCPLTGINRWIEEFKGLNPGHALWMAKQNYDPSYHVTLISSQVL